MPDTITNLWSPQLKSKVLSPFAILRIQASQVSPMTQGILRAEVAPISSEKQMTINLEIVAPALNNYRYLLLSVKHDINIYYPSIVSSKGLTIRETVKTGAFRSEEKINIESVATKVAYSEDQFIAILKEALQAPENIALLQSLIARSNEEANPVEVAENTHTVQLEEQN